MVTASASALLEICGRQDGPDFIGRRGVTETAIASGEPGELRALCCGFSVADPLRSLLWHDRTLGRCQLWWDGSSGVCLFQTFASFAHVSLPFIAADPSGCVS